MSSEWSPNDTKAELIEVCEARGLEADNNMLKDDIVAMLEADDAALVTTATAEPAPKPAAPKSSGGGVYEYLLAAGGRVSFEKVLEDCGEGAKAELQELVGSGKVVQYKRYHKFWFSAR